MKPALAIAAVPLALLAFGSAKNARAAVQAGEGAALPAFGLDNLIDLGENLMNKLTERAADVSAERAGRNIAAFLNVIRRAEGTAQAQDPYRVCFGYAWTVRDMSDHPAVTGEWRGERLPDQMCRNAGFGPGCVSTAAGAYQIIKPTWLKLRGTLGLADFSPASQDAAALELIAQRGALEDVKAGRFSEAIDKVRNEWASLPGNYAKQGQRSFDDLSAWYLAAGGQIDQQNA